MLKTTLISGTILAMAFGTVSAQGCHSGSSTSSHEKMAMSEEKSAKDKVQTKCPVMGNTVNQSIFFIWKNDKNGESKKIYFCCPSCIDTFKKDPDKYIKKLEKMKQPVEKVVSANEIWTCTMCPDVKSDKAGKCPKCGMALIKKE